MECGELPSGPGRKGAREVDGEGSRRRKRHSRPTIDVSGTVSFGETWALEAAVIPRKRNLLGKPSEMRVRRTGFPLSREMAGISKGISSQMTPTLRMPLGIQASIERSAAGTPRRGRRGVPNHLRGFVNEWLISWPN